MLEATDIQYGICPKCKQKLQLICEAGVPNGSYVLPTHNAQITMENALGNTECPGSGKVALK